jgi:hypothetical protein
MAVSRPMTMTKKALNSSDVVYRRKLGPGDVILLVMGNHFNIAVSLFSPSESNFRIPLRNVVKSKSGLKDYEKQFLQFVVATHQNFDKEDDDTRSGPKLEQLIKCYAEYKEEIWNALIGEIYLQYSKRGGSAVVANFNAVNVKLSKTTLIDTLFRAHPPHLFSEIITRPRLMEDETNVFKSRLPADDDILELRDRNYYTGVTGEIPYVVSLAGVELNGVRIGPDNIENQTWNLIDWQYSNIPYLVKQVNGAPAPLGTLKTRKNIINMDNKTWKLEVRNRATIGYGLWVSRVGNSSQLRRSMQGKHGRKLPIGEKEVLLLKPSMIQDQSLSNTFNLK